MKQVFAETFKHVNAFGKTKNYLRVKNELGEKIMQVGEETYKAVLKMQGGEDAKLFEEGKAPSLEETIKNIGEEKIAEMNAKAGKK